MFAKTHTIFLFLLLIDNSVIFGVICQGLAPVVSLVLRGGERGWGEESYSFNTGPLTMPKEKKEARYDLTRPAELPRGWVGRAVFVIPSESW